MPVVGEAELAYRFEKGRVAAITGTNGKTTTTTLVGEILKKCYPEVFVVGNIGIPYTSIVEKTTEQTVTVTEISSFQLETMETFHPSVSAILNITPDHLDRHHTMEALSLIHISAKRTFQAIRIELNHELEVLSDHLDEMIDLLNPGGRICIITFHSLEDRIVKSNFKRNENPCTCPSDFPVCVCGKVSKGKVITRKPILPSEKELEENSRSKSAKLRVFERR